MQLPIAEGYIGLERNNKILFSKICKDVTFFKTIFPSKQAAKILPAMKRAEMWDSQNITVTVVMILMMKIIPAMWGYLPSLMILEVGIRGA